MTTAPQEFPVQFGRYRLLRKLAKGGMAELFLATRPGSSQQLVIKRVLPHFCSDTEFLTMFLNEARIAAQLNHPNIVGVYDLGQQGEHIYIAMEFIDGADLERLTKDSGGTMPPHLAARIGVSICEALYYANRSPDVSTGKPLNVIHRDVTPGNVMLTRAGEVKLVDFGVAKATAQLERTRPGVVKGKFRYMSPEQIQLKELDGRSDLFSLGVLLYEVTTGKKPFDRTQVIDIIRALSGWNPPPPADFVPGYPRALSDVIMVALRKDPDQRYRDGREMSRALEAALQQMQPAGAAELSQYVISHLDPPPVSEPPPWAEHADGKTDPSAAYPSGRSQTPRAGGWGDGKTDPSAAYPSPPPERSQPAAPTVTRNEMRRRPTSVAQPARATPPRGPLAPPVRTPPPAPDRAPRGEPAPLPPPIAALSSDPFGDEEKTTLAPGPFSDLREPPRLEPAARPPLRRGSRPRVSLEDALGEDEGPQTVTNRDRAPNLTKPRRNRRLLLFALFALLVITALAIGLKRVEVPSPTAPLDSPAQPSGAAAGSAEDARGTLRFDGPERARYVVDERHACTAPCALELSAGPHVVSRQGQKKLQVEVVAGQIKAISF